MDINTIALTMPEHYRWANEEDLTVRAMTQHPEWFVQVVTAGSTFTEGSTDLAILWDCYIEFGEHNHDPVECERTLGDMESTYYPEMGDDEYDNYFNGSSHIGFPVGVE